MICARKVILPYVNVPVLVQSRQSFGGRLDVLGGEIACRTPLAFALNARGLVTHRYYCP